MAWKKVPKRINAFMESMLNVALSLAKKHFHVFPLTPNAKKPPKGSRGGNRVATCNEEEVRRLWTDPVLGLSKDFNVGISMRSYNGGETHLVAVDVDTKNDKKGDEEVLKWELEGLILPPTYTQKTPSGGLHLLYKTGSIALKSSTSKLARGIDMMGVGLYVVGAGSTIDGKAYEILHDLPLADAPEWLLEKCKKVSESERRELKEGLKVDEKRAIERAIFFLENEAELAVKGQGGDAATFRVACECKDFGLSPQKAHEFMLEHWNERTTPGWTPERLWEKVSKAYAYGHDAPGIMAPEAVFDVLPSEPPPPSKIIPVQEIPQIAPAKSHPFDELNKQWAFVLAGNKHHIIWETLDAKGRYQLRHIAEESFHAMHAANTMTCGESKKAVTKLWMNSPKRRTYNGFDFAPECPVQPGFFNLWKGFRVKPVDSFFDALPEHQDITEEWLAHLHENICQGDKALTHWLTGWFAQLFQKPWEKPHTAIVFQGEQGVGKNALVDRIGHILGPHYLQVVRKRQVLGNFNSFLENKIFVVMNEAFWSGDKEAQGTLKDLITGNEHLIEHKYSEPFVVDNLTRVCVMSNEEWVIPAGPDERRYAVFEVGNKRQEQKAYFRRLQKGMEAGAYSVLLRYFLDYDFSDIDVNRAPVTEGLYRQKVRSSEPFYQWWLECLTEGRIVDGQGDETHTFPKYITKENFREAFGRYMKGRHIQGRMPQVGRYLKACIPSVKSDQKIREGSHTYHAYKLPELDVARAEWAKFFRHEVIWDERKDEDAVSNAGGISAEMEVAQTNFSQLEELR